MPSRKNLKPSKLKLMMQEVQSWEMFEPTQYTRWRNLVAKFRDEGNLELDRCQYKAWKQLRSE